MSEVEQQSHLRDVANAASLFARAADDARPDSIGVPTPYGHAVVHVTDDGAYVELPEGATVHVRSDRAAGRSETNP